MISIYFKVATILLKVKLLGKGLLFLPFFLIQNRDCYLFLTHTNIDTKSRSHQFLTSKEKQNLRQCK